MHRAKELALFADIISAKEAAEMGLVNRVVPAGELDAFVADWAKRLAAGPPIALGMTKRLLSNSFSMTMDEALEAEALAQSVNSGTEDTSGGDPRLPRQARAEVQGSLSARAVAIPATAARAGSPLRPAVDLPAHASRFLWKRPPFMMAERCAPWSWKSLRLSSGLPSTTSRSAKAPRRDHAQLALVAQDARGDRRRRLDDLERGHHLAPDQELAALLLLELA